jgi:hypothetical protein
MSIWKLNLVLHLSIFSILDKVIAAARVILFNYKQNKKENLALIFKKDWFSQGIQPKNGIEKL